MSGGTNLKPYYRFMSLLRQFNQFSWAARNAMWWARLAHNAPKSNNVAPAVVATVLTTVLFSFIAGPAGFLVCMTLWVMVAFVRGMVKLDRYVRAPRAVRPVLRERPENIPRPKTPTYVNGVKVMS